MLGLLGLMGALFAGVVAEAFSSDPRDSTEDPQPDDAPEDADPAESQLDNIFGMLSASPPLTEGPDDGDAAASEPAAAPPEDLWLTGDEANNILSGEGGGDSLSGNGGDDMLCGHDGNDSLDGGDGRDGLNGGTGDDTLLGQAGDDTLHGDFGNDSLVGGEGNDRLEACEGDDTLYGGAGNDVLIAGGGNDLMHGDGGDDALVGGTENDLLYGGTGSDTLDGGAGNDELWGQDDRGDDQTLDFLNGGAGDDMLHLGAGDYGNGGDGADSFALQDIAPGDALPQIVDFNAADDHLIVFYDATLHPDPQLTADTSESGTTLLLDGVAVANLQATHDLDLSTVELRAA